MKITALEFLVCPECKQRLDARPHSWSGPEIPEGTFAVDAAYADIGRHGHVHLIQVDTFAMPFRTSTVDLAGSIGALHRTPDPRTAFDRVAATVKAGGGSSALRTYDDYGPAAAADEPHALPAHTAIEPQRGGA